MTALWWKAIRHRAGIPLFLDGRLGADQADLLRYHDPASDYRPTLDLGSPRQGEARQQARREELAESLRLAYVALTRAKKSLYVCFPLRYYHFAGGFSDRHSMAQLTRFLADGPVNKVDPDSGKMEPVRIGGEMVLDVTAERATWNEVPHKFEAGTPAIAEAMGVSLSTVNRAHMAYDHGGRKALEPKPIGGRQRQNMTLAEEKALLNRFAKAAGAGEMLNIHDLKAAYEKAIGHETSNSTIYNLLARHGWRKLMPRPFHPQRNIAAQNSFKKTAFQML